MSNAAQLRELASKCEELAKIAPTKVVKDKQLSLAASYRRMADREDWLDRQHFPSLDEKLKSNA